MTKRAIALAGLIILICHLAAPSIAGWDPQEGQEAEAAVTAFKLTDPDLKLFFEKAYGYAVFPSVGKAGMGFGGAYGKGVVFEQGKEIGNTSLKQLSMGFQFGGESYREIIFFQDKETLDEFKQGNYELGTQATAVVVKKGASKNSDFADGVAVFTQTKGGMMFDVSVAGQKFTFDPI